MWGLQWAFAFQFSLSAAGDVRQFAHFLTAAWTLPRWLGLDGVLPYVITVTLLVPGLRLALKHAPAGASVLERFVLCGPVFFATPMAVFGAQHFLDHVAISKIIPKWVPAHVFLTYFVGVCLVAGSLGIVFRRLAGLAAGMTGIMFLCFEAFMHIPIAVIVPRNPQVWAILTRDFCFGWGALSLAATHTSKWRVEGRHWLVTVARLFIGVGIIFYGVEQVLHPGFLPGVPLNEVTPSFIPGHQLWGYVAGFVYIVGGGFLLTKRKEQSAAMWLGIFAFCIVLVFCIPFAIELGGGIAALDVPLDTLMFSGALLCLSLGLAGRPSSPGNESGHTEPAVTASVPVS